MSPILVRPVREQLEHDRIIRLLQAKSRRRFEAGINPGAEQNVAVGAGASAVYPDLVLFSPKRGKRPHAVVEVETGESVNHLEALAQWAHFSRLRPAFHLYVPAAMVDVARRLCEDNQVRVQELWSYFTVGEDVRFTLVHRTRDQARPASPAGRATRRASTKPSTLKRAAGARSAARTRSGRRPARPQKRK